MNFRIAFNRIIVNRGKEQLEREKFTKDQLFADQFVNVTLTPEEFVMEIRQGHAYCSPLKEEAGYRRSTAAFAGSAVISIDVDSGMTLKEALENDFIKANGLLIYTSSNHQRVKKSGSAELPPCDRFRVLFLLEEEITDPSEYIKATRALVAYFKADPASSDPCRLFFGNTNAETFILGHLLHRDVLASVIRLTAQEAVKPSPRPRSLLPMDYREFTADDVLDMLQKINLSGKLEVYEDWRDCVLAVLDYLPSDEALYVLGSWTTFKDGELRSMARSNENRIGARVSIRTLIRMAKAAGWKKQAKNDDVQRYITQLSAATIRSLLDSVQGRATHDNVADFFAKLYKYELFYYDRSGKRADAWLTWSGKYWERGAMLPSRLATMALHVANAILGASSMNILPSTAQNIEAVLRLARSKMFNDTLQWDTENVLVFNNGVIDLDGDPNVFLEHDKGFMSTGFVSWDYDPKCQRNDRWEKFVSEIFVQIDREPDDELVRQMQRYFGYCMTNSVSEQVFVILFGRRGGNGKGTLFNVLNRLLEDYCVNIPANEFSTDNKDERGRTIARIRGRRLVLSSESEDGNRVKASLLKLLSGGDKLTGANLYENSEEFWPTHKLVFAVNHLPEARGDDAFFRRVVIVPMQASFHETDDPAYKVGDDSPERDLETTLLMNPSGIVRWIIDGLVDYKEQGLQLRGVGSVAEASREYMMDSDSIRQFIEECCDDRPDVNDLGKMIYDAYRKWRESNGYTKHMSIKKLYGDLKDKGFRTQRTGGGIRVFGIRAKAQWLAPNEDQF